MFSCSIVPDSATPWIVTCQAPLSMEFSTQEYWSGLPFPSPGDLPNPGIEHQSPALQADSLPLRHQEAQFVPCDLVLLFPTNGFKCSVQFISVAQPCPTLCNSMNHSMPDLPIHHHLPEFTQTYVHRVGDTIQPSHPLSSPFPPALNPSQHQSLFQ